MYNHRSAVTVTRDGLQFKRTWIRRNITTTCSKCSSGLSSWQRRACPSSYASYKWHIVLILCKIKAHLHNFKATWSIPFIALIRTNHFCLQTQTKSYIKMWYVILFCKCFSLTQNWGKTFPNVILFLLVTSFNVDLFTTKVSIEVLFWLLTMVQSEPCAVGLWWQPRTWVILAPNSS